MRAKSVNENQNFERGQSPKDSMKIGMGDEFMILSVDAQDEFHNAAFPDDEQTSHMQDGRIMQIDGPMPYEEAKKLYNSLKGNVSNVYLVNVLDKEEYI